MEIILEHLNWILMGFFVLLYSMLVILKDVEGKLASFYAIYMGSGMLFVYYIFQISYLEEYEEFEYIIAISHLLTFRDLLPVIVDFVVKVSQVDWNKYETECPENLKQQKGIMLPMLVPMLTNVIGGLCAMRD